jgi:hypothetical protein
MYEKFEKLKDMVDASTRQTMAERLFVIGKDAYQAQNMPRAVQWLEYALTHMVETEAAMLSKDAEELKLAVYDSLVKAKIAQGTPESAREAQEHVEYLQTRLGDSPIVLFLRIHLLESVPGEELDVDAFAVVLRKLAKSFSITLHMVDWMCVRLLALYERRPQVAMQILDELLVGRVLPTESEEWTTKVFGLRVKMATMVASGGPEPLPALLDRALGNLGKPLTARTVTAIQSVGGVFWCVVGVLDSDGMHAGHLAQDRG